MKRLLSLLIVITISYPSFSQSEKDANMIRSIFDEALERGESYEMLRFLTKNIGGRLAGSPQAAAAVEWTRQKMMSYGFDTVYLQPVMVPHWVREEIGRIVNSKKIGSMDIKVVSLEMQSVLGRVVL